MRKHYIAMIHKDDAGFRRIVSGLPRRSHRRAHS